MSSFFTWVLVVIGAFLAFVGFLHLLDKFPYVHRKIPQLDLETYLDILLRSGFEGGFIVIRLPKDPRFIQFARRYEGHPGLELGFPNAPWSREYFRVLQQVLQRHEIPYFTKRMAEEGEEPVTEFLYVNSGEDVYAAGDLSRTIFQEVFGLDEDTRVELYFRDVSPKEIWPGSQPTT